MVQVSANHNISAYNDYSNSNYHHPQGHAVIDTERRKTSIDP